jgi:hypothetical protein
MMVLFAQELEVMDQLFLDLLSIDSCHGVTLRLLSIKRTGSISTIAYTKFLMILTSEIELSICP